MSVRRSLCPVLALTLAAAAGCLASPAPVTLVLVNETALDVTPGVYVSATATDSAGLFVAANLLTDFTDRPFPELRSQETITLSLDCADVAALGVRQARLFNAATVVTVISDDELLFRKDAEFACGQTIRLRYAVEGDRFRVRSSIE